MKRKAKNPERTEFKRSIRLKTVNFFLNIIVFVALALVVRVCGMSQYISN